MGPLGGSGGGGSSSNGAGGSGGGTGLVDMTSSMMSSATPLSAPSGTLSSSPSPLASSPLSSSSPSSSSLSSPSSWGAIVLAAAAGAAVAGISSYLLQSYIAEQVKLREKEFWRRLAEEQQLRRGGPHRRPVAEAGTAAAAAVAATAAAGGSSAPRRRGTPPPLPPQQQQHQQQASAVTIAAPTPGQQGSTASIGAVGPQALPPVPPPPVQQQHHLIQQQQHPQQQVQQPPHLQLLQQQPLLPQLKRPAAAGGTSSPPLAGSSIGNRSSSLLIVGPAGATGGLLSPRAGAAAAADPFRNLSGRSLSPTGRGAFLVPVSTSGGGGGAGGGVGVENQVGGGGAAAGAGGGGGGGGGIMGSSNNSNFHRPAFAPVMAAMVEDGQPVRAVSMHSMAATTEEDEIDEIVDEQEQEEIEEEEEEDEVAALDAVRRAKDEGKALQDGGENMKMALVQLQSESVANHAVSDPEVADFLRKCPEQEEYVRVNVAPLDEPSPEDMDTLKLIQECLTLRDKYVFREAVPPWRRDPTTLPMPDPANPFRFDPVPKTEHVFEMVDGVVRVYANERDREARVEKYPVHDATTFFTDMHHVLKVTSLGPVRTLAFHRLKLLEQKFNLHLTLNGEREKQAQKSAPHRDLYNVRKVDTHVHHSACMNQKHLLRFIKSKLRKEPDEVVIFRDGKYLTLKEVFESLDLTGYDLNVDLLDVHADKNTFHRFDKFNLKYNPCGQSRLREIFIKQDNLIQGRFLAELTKEVFTDLVASKYQMAEYRISIYGRKKSEWDNLANWVVNNELYCENVVWLIQLPRLYNIYKDMGIIDSFQTVLDNIFLPLFEVTLDPTSHPHLHVFLKHVVGFDMVDDESKPERRPTKHMPKPAEWVNPFNPAYSYYAYYCYANLLVLNKLREERGLSILRFRPHCGEAGDIDHLAAAFLLTHNIAHGNNLRRSPALQYLFYLAQIGLAMSPLSNNSLFLDYQKNPFPVFFARGLNVSLSTDDPLMIHLTKEPLVEEYSIAAQVWRLSSCDLCEIARNSVYQSGFWHPVKAHWVGPKYYIRGPRGNDIHQTNVPHIRMEFRHEVWQAEMQYVFVGEAQLPEEVQS